MKQSLKESLIVLGKLLRTLFKKRIILLVEPHHPNLGDLAQLMCTRRWIASKYPEFKLVEVGQFFVPFDNNLKSHFLNFNVLKLLFIKWFTHKNDYLIGHSGYFFIDHHTGWFAYELILNYLPHNKFIILPQTINFYDPFVIDRVKKTFSNHPNLTLLCRDEVSYRNASSLFHGIKLLKFPDIVTSLIGSIRFNNERDGVLFCLRDDVETFYKEEEIDNFKSRFGKIRKETVDTTIKRTMDEIERNSQKYIYEMIEKMSTFEVVITDRYHGTIFSAIASTPVIVINSADHKLSSGVLWFPEEIFKGMVQFADNLDDAFIKAKNILGNTDFLKENPPYFKKTYWDMLKI